MMKNRGDILLSPWVCSGLVYSGVRVCVIITMFLDDT